MHRPRSVPADSTRCLLTEYHDTYREFPLSGRAKPIRPDNRTKLSKDPFNNNTTYKEIYVPHQYKPPSKPGQAAYVKPTGEMNTSSTYRTDYLKKQAEKPKLAKPNVKPVASGCPFDGSTVHNQTYKAWDIPKTESVRPANQGIRRSSAKFDHCTTVQHDYPGYFGKLARETVKPPEPSLKSGTGAMSSETTHRLDFDRKDGHPEKSAKPFQKDIRHPGPFDHKTTNQHAFTWPDGLPAETCKPSLAAFSSQKPFEGDTTYKNTFKKWAVEPMDAWKPQVAWKPPAESFEQTTTFRHDYQGKHVSKAKSARPETVRVAPGDFDGSTTHNETYKPWGYSQRETLKPRAGYRPPTVPFYGQTTHLSHFRGEQAKKPDICAPKASGIQISGDQEFSTNYNDDYRKKRLPPCPARDLHPGELHASTDGYKFVKDNNGHQYFYPPNAMGMGEIVETVALA